MVLFSEGGKYINILFKVIWPCIVTDLLWIKVENTLICYLRSYDRAS